MLGKAFSHYRVLDTLGQGGMGVVYLAEDTLLGRRVAIKFPNADPRFSDRLLAEARTASSLNHPAIAAIHDCGIHEGHPYVVMELVEGENLKQRLKRGSLPPQRAIEIAIETASALSEAHRHNIVHRDIKPSNIQLGPRGAVKVLDFGLAKNLAAVRTFAAGAGASTQTADYTFAGTPPYMSPEQARSEPVDARSDLFSLGAVLWECLTGQPAFAGSTPLDVLACVLHADLPPPSTINPAVPPVLDDICSRALAKDPAHRYQSAQALLLDLESAQSAPALPAAPAVRSRPRLLLPAAAVVLVAALIVLAVHWLRRPREPDPQALRWYQEGANAIYDGTYFKAAKALDRAVSIDPGFALAHARLAEASDELDDSTTAREQILEAVAPAAFRSHLSSRDEMTVEAVRRSLANDPAGAAALYRQLLQRVPASEKAAAYLDLGRACEKAGQPKEALSSYREAARLSPQYAAAFLHLGVLDQRAQRFADAEGDFARAESLYESLSNTEGLVAVLYERGVLANKRGDLQQAAELLRKALDTARAAGSQQQQIETLLQISNVEYQQGNPAGAAQQAADATDLARRSGLQLLTAGALVGLGNAYFVRGDMQQAQTCFQQSLDDARRYRSPRIEAHALLSLGSLHIQQEDLARGVQEVRQALRFYDQGGDARERSMALLLLGRATRDQGDYATAMQAFQQQLDLALKTGAQTQLAVARDGVASVLDSQERYPEALAAYRQVFADSQARADRLSAAYALANSAAMLGRIGRFREAREALAQAVASGGYRELAHIADQYQAEMALSERRFAAARGLARRLLSAAADLSADDLIGAYAIDCTAGFPTQGLSACQTALDLARKSGRPNLISAALLVWAETQLETGNPAQARDAALSARAQFARGGQHESEARALLIAARAAQISRDASAASSLAAQASRSFEALLQSWTPDDRAVYESRPDVRRWRAQLAGLSTR